MKLKLLHDLEDCINSTPAKDHPCCFGLKSERVEGEEGQDLCYPGALKVCLCSHTEGTGEDAVSLHDCPSLNLH